MGSHVARWLSCPRWTPASVLQSDRLRKEGSRTLTSRARNRAPREKDGPGEVSTLLYMYIIAATRWESGIIVGPTRSVSDNVALWVAYRVGTIVDCSERVVMGIARLLLLRVSVFPGRALNIGIRITILRASMWRRAASLAPMRLKSGCNGS